MSHVMQAIWIMFGVGAVAGFCFGFFYGSWKTDKQHERERKERQEIADLARIERAKAKQEPIMVDLNINGERLAEFQSEYKEALKRRS